MQLRAQDIFPTLEPFRVVADLRLPLENREGLFFTPHPQHPEDLLQIEDHEFVGRADGLTPACNVFDFLALHFGSYRQAIDHVIGKYFNLASLPTGLAWDSVGDQIVERLRNDREQFQSVLALRNGLRERSDRLGVASMFCRGKEFDPDHIWRMLYFAHGRDLNRVLRNWLKREDVFDATKCYLVVPYMVNRHSYGLLEIRDLNEKHVQTVVLNPSRYMFFGMHTCLPDNRETQVFSTRQEASLMYSRAMERADFQIGFLHVRVNANAEIMHPPLRSGTFIVTENADFNTLANTRRAFETFEVIDPQDRFGRASEPTSWRDYAANSVLKALREDPADPEREYSVRTSGMIESLRNSEAFPALLKQLEAQNKTAVVSRIRRQASHRGVYVLGGMHIIETSTGYLATKPGTDTVFPFANFVIRIDSSIWFPESQEVYFSGWIILSGQRIPFAIANSQVHQPKTILVQAQRAANRSGILNLSMPTVTDPAHQRKLVGILAQQIGTKPTIIGVQVLGWNSTKQRFVAPVWEARNLGLQSTSKVPYPESKILARYFSFLDYRLVDDVSKVTPQARYLIALVAGSIARAFLNQQVPTVAIIRSPESVALIQSVFRPFGQVAPVELGPTRRLAQQTLSTLNFSGFPIFATCPDIRVLKDVNSPLFLLGRSGESLNDPVDAEALSQITSLGHRVFTSLILKFIREPLQAQGLIDKDEAGSANGLALEGKRVIEASAGMGPFDLLEQELPLLKRFLSGVVPDKANQFFRYDHSASLVFIRCRMLRNLTRKPLYQELVAKNADVKLRGRHYITCPSDWFLDVLARAFGRPAVLDHRADDMSQINETQNDSQAAAT